MSYINPMNHLNLSLKRLIVLSNIKRIENKKKYKNRLKHLRRDYKKLSKRIDNIVWGKMSRRLAEEDFRSAYSLAKIEERDAFES